MKNITTLVVLGIAAAAFSQDLINTAGLSARVGGIYPFEKSTRNVTGNMFGLGLDIALKTTYVKGSDAFLSFDYFGKSTDGKNGNILGAMLNQRFMSGSGSRPMYTFAGVGFMIVDVNKSKTVLGARGGVGTNLGEHVFAEAVLTVSGNANGAKANTVGLYLGYKF